MTRPSQSSTSDQAISQFINRLEKHLLYRDSGLLELLKSSALSAKTISSINQYITDYTLQSQYLMADLEDIAPAIVHKIEQELYNNAYAIGTLSQSLAFNLTYNLEYMTCMQLLLKNFQDRIFYENKVCNTILEKPTFQEHSEPCTENNKTQITPSLFSKNHQDNQINRKSYGA